MIKQSSKRLYVVGDIHGRFDYLLNSIENQNITDSTFILCGDCGLGFNFKEYYDDFFDRYNTLFMHKNNYVFMLRGNHDDPSYFNGENVINLSNIKSLPDYSVLQVSSPTNKAKSFNILCVGGGISIDRYYRKQRYKSAVEARTYYLSKWESEHLTKRTYWEDEAPVYKEELLKEIIESNKINIVCTHTAPSFCPKDSFDDIKDFFKMDLTLKKDLKKERDVMDKIYFFLRNHKQYIKYWFYGHFHAQDSIKVDRTEFIMLDKENMFNVNMKRIY